MHAVHLKRFLFCGVKEFLRQKKLLDKFNEDKRQSIKRERFSRWFFEAYKSQKIKYLKDRQETKLLRHALIMFRDAVRYNKLIQRFQRKMYGRFMKTAWSSLRLNRLQNYQERDLMKIAEAFYEKQVYRKLISRLKDITSRMRYSDPIIYEQKYRQAALA